MIDMDAIKEILEDHRGDIKTLVGLYVTEKFTPYQAVEMFLDRDLGPQVVEYDHEENAAYLAMMLALAVDELAKHQKQELSAMTPEDQAKWAAKLEETVEEDITDSLLR